MMKYQSRWQPSMVATSLNSNSGHCRNKRFDRPNWLLPMTAPRMIQFPLPNTLPGWPPFESIYRSAATKGYRQNFVDAASFCTSELIAFCDQDDIWHKEKLAEVRKHFLDSSVLLVHHNSRVVDGNGMPLGTLVPGGTHPQEAIRSPSIRAPLPWVSPSFSVPVR